MTSIASVRIHASQFPEKVRRDLLASLRSRRVNHKFHYDSVKQTQKWLALHRAYSPDAQRCGLRRDLRPGFCRGGGTNQSKGGARHRPRLRRRTKGHAPAETVESAGREIFYTPCDVSTAMVLIARQAALAVVPEKNCFPLVCDLAVADDLLAVLDSRITHHASRLLTFFGMIPNFEPQIILPKLASLVRPKDILLFSANLAPGKNYAAGLKKVLPQYDNPLTRDWLMTFLRDLGVGAPTAGCASILKLAGADSRRLKLPVNFCRDKTETPHVGSRGSGD